MRYTIDVSKWDSYDPRGNLLAVDWERTGFPIAMIKVSEGTVEDPGFKIQWKAAQKLKRRVAYHFFRSDVNAITAALKTWAIVEDDFTPNDLICIDFERLYGGVSGPTAIMQTGSFIYELEKKGLTAKQIMFYTGSTWTECGGAKATWAAKYRLWVAHWPWDNIIANTKISLPPYLFTKKLLDQKKALIESGKAVPLLFPPYNGVLAPWKTWDVWQFTSRADPSEIPGYYSTKHQVDYNYIKADDLIESTPLPTNCPTCGKPY